MRGEYRLAKGAQRPSAGHPGKEHAAAARDAWTDALFKNCPPLRRSGEELVQQLLEGIFSRPPGRHRSVEIDR